MKPFMNLLPEHDRQELLEVVAQALDTESDSLSEKTDLLLSVMIETELEEVNDSLKTRGPDTARHQREREDCPSLFTTDSPTQERFISLPA